MQKRIGRKNTKTSIRLIKYMLDVVYNMKCITVKMEILR